MLLFTASIVNQTKKKFNVTFIKLLSFEVKVDKCEPKVVVLPQHGHRFMIFSNKNPSKLEYSFHYLDIKSLESKTPQESTFPLLSLESLIPKIDLTPGERMTTLTKQLDAIVVSDHSACSGFSRMYVCVCDLYGYSLVEEIIWDLDTIYLSHDSRTLYLRDFDHLAVRVTDHHTVSRDHVPLLGALQFNEWFSGLDASNMRMTAEALAEILKVTRKNNSLTTLNLASTGLKSDFLQKFSSALSSNLTSKIVSLNLSGNILEDKGISYLSEAISNMVHGMQSLDLAQCSIGNKGVNRLMESISSNHIMANTLCTLYLSGNNLKGDELRALYNFLAQPNVLQKLDLSDTETPLEPLFTALTRGSTQHMEELNVSGNPFTNKKSKDGKPSSSWKQFFSSALVLSKLNMSNTRLPAPALKDLLTGLSSNVNKPLVYLDLSCNDLRSEGGMVLGSCVANLQNIHGLDLSDNGLDVNLTEILPWFGKNGTIHHLSIGKNFSQLRNKALQQALEGLVRAIQDEHCALESLSIADSKLRLDTTVIINALGSNSTLKSLDISGNQIGDIGAKMLAKALTINSTLTSVTWDRNNITAAGLRDVSQALQRNMTMLEMPLPIFDIAASVRINPDMIHSASMQIQTCLQRNHALKKINYDQCYRLQQGFLVSSAQTIIDKKVRNIHIILNSLCESDSLSPEEFAQTNKLLADADRAKQILMALQAVVSKCEEPPNKFSDSIKQVTHTLTGSVNNQLEQVRLDMLKMVSQECNSVVASKETESMLESGAQSRGQLSPSEIGGLIDRHFVSDIQNKLSLLNFNMAFYIAEEVIEKVVDLLQAKYKELKTLKRGTLESTATIQSTQSEGAVDVNEELADSISPTLGMTYLGDTHENRMSVMKTLKRRPQSILVKSPEETNREFTGAMNSQSGADDQTEQTVVIAENAG
ncbi:LRRC16A [Bugula neritina]|uniref:LRRC16A n=1 Tax=Bugula neritina TaxID=10212 RepID=A0A7J7K2S2_BUGNE|nr:LRRC16A [Bugula neritina]